MEVSLYPMDDPEGEGMLLFADLFSKLKELEARAMQLGFPELKPARVSPRGAA